jgi:DNA-directed RNA polymerase subunit RPC12/RpoP
MSKKLTYEFVKQSFESEGYILLSEKYVNAHSKLDYVCPKGHKHSIDWDKWYQGVRCAYCSKRIIPIFETMKRSFSEAGFILISEHCNSSTEKLYYICTNGHNHSVSWNDWNREDRRGCPYCSKKAKPSLYRIKKAFENSGYTLISDSYSNCSDKLNYICDNGHERSMSWNNWRKGHRCPTCAIIKYTGSGSSSWLGGISYEPYCPIWKDKEYKKDIRLRDGNKCLNPTCNKKDHRLHIHHIDYNKKSCSPSNVITLCGSCNSRANTNREWHTAWYQALMYRRYKYEYRKF